MMNEFSLVSIRSRLVRLPLDDSAVDAIQTFDTLELPMVELSDKGGRSGLGFGYTIGRGGSTIHELLQSELLPRLAGRDSRRIVQIGEELVNAIHALTPGCLSSTALAAIDVALWDLASKRAGLPLYLFLGGAQRSVPLYNTHVGWLSRSLPDLLERSREAVHYKGFTALKLKVGKDDPEEDEERVARVRETVGRTTRLMLDANQSWTFDEAVRRLKRLERYDITWIEEPLAATDEAGYQDLRLHCTIARAGGESLYSSDSFYRCLQRNSLDLLQPDISRVGGITPALRVCQLAAAARVRVSPHVCPELSVTVATAVPNGFFVEFIPQLAPLLRTPLWIREGHAIPRDVPGHGIDFDREAIETYSTEQGEAA